MSMSAMSVAAKEFSYPQGYESGTPLGVPTRSLGGKLLENTVSACTKDGCTKKVRCRGLCKNHYYKAWSRGRIQPLPKRTLEDRFWSRVSKKAGTECWEWLGRPNSTGYGLIVVNGTKIGTHRVAWALTNGQIPNGLFVCHICDNRICVRPDHLFLGTAGDNTRDMCQKGRANGPRGEANANAILTEDLVRRIRADYDAGLGGPRMLSNKYGTGYKTVQSVCYRSRWKHVQ